MYSQWDQGLWWEMMIDAIWSVIMPQSSAVASSFLGIGTSVKDLSLVQWTKGPNKAILGKTLYRVTLQILSLLFLKHEAHAFFFFLLDYGKIWSFFLIYCDYFMRPYILFFMMCSLPVHFTLSSNQLTNSMGETQWTLPLESLLSQEGMCILGTCIIASYVYFIDRLCNPKNILLGLCRSPIEFEITE